MSRAKFVSDLDSFAKACLDTAVAIYHLEDVEPYSHLTEVAFAAVAAGKLAAVWSTISVTELLAKPFAEGRMDRVALCEQFIRSFNNATLVAPGFAVAKEAARLRGQYGLRAPDALIAATALDEKADALVTNDNRWRKLRREGIAIVALDDYV